LSRRRRDLKSFFGATHVAAPASRAFSSTSSSEILSASTEMMPLRSNIHATAPEAPILPPNFSNVCRISGPVRFRLSVKTLTMTATPPGA